MNNQIDITLNSAGFVLFDPESLQSFVLQNDLPEELFESFQEKPEVGDAAIRSGIIFPVYSIPPLDYRILITIGLNSTVNPQWIKFTTPVFPLVCDSGKIIVSDIDAIMDWDYTFYKKVEQDSMKKPYNAFSLDISNYSLQVVGFCESGTFAGVPTNKGYELLLSKVEKLPEVSDKIDSDSIDYTVYGSL